MLKTRSPSQTLRASVSRLKLIMMVQSEKVWLVLGWKKNLLPVVSKTHPRSLGLESCTCKKQTAWLSESGGIKVASSNSYFSHCRPLSKACNPPTAPRAHEMAALCSMCAHICDGKKAENAFPYWRLPMQTLFISTKTLHANCQHGGGGVVIWACFYSHRIWAPCSLWIALNRPAYQSILHN